MTDRANFEHIAELSSEQKRALLAQLLREQADESQALHPLSYGQQALWFLYQLAPHSSAYHIIFLGRIRSQVDSKAMQHALQMLMERHPILRCTFTSHADGPVQRIQEHLEVDFEVRESTDWHQDRIDGYLAEECQRPFDLENGPVFRVKLLPRSVQDHLLLLVAHHIVLDGWSFRMLLTDLRELYLAAKAHTRPALPPVGLQYWDYVHWQRHMLASPEGEKLRAYWQKQLAGAPPVLQLPVARPRPPIQRYRGASLPFTLPTELSRALYDLALREGATMYTICLAALQVLLYRYAGQEDILVGTPAAGRTRADFEKIVGYFISPIVLRANLAGNPTFKAFLHQVRETVRAGLAHQDYPFPLLVEQLQPDRDPSYSPVFQVMLDLRRADMGVNGDAAEFDLELLTRAQQEGQFDLLLDVFEVDRSVFGDLRYDTDLFDAPTIARMLGHFQALLESVSANPDQRVALLPLLTDAERHQLLVAWNDTGADDRKDACLHELFAAQAERTPDAIAVVSGEERLTYQELNRRANQLAHYLQTLGVAPEVLVGICVERSLDMVLGLLGILKAGGAYVPLDPAYPRERLAFILQDAQVSVLLTQQPLVTQLPAHEAQVVCLDADWETISHEREETPGRSVVAHNLAYVIYTSGSTGRPKGVAIEHRHAVALLDWARPVFTPEQRAGMLASTSICFDLSIFELFLPLCWGGKIILAEHLLQLPNLSAAQEVTLINTVPSLIAELLRVARIPSSVRTVSLAGEPLSTSLVHQLYKQDGLQEVYDLYGPSECTTYSTFTLRHSDRPATIGRPIAHTQIYLLDAFLNPVPIGIPGELYIGGAGVVRSYLCRPELTAEKFIPSPFSEAPDARLYKTGDLACYFPDGNIAFLGRSDYQVKMRGFRIELGEIEAVLSQHAAVREATVMVRQDVPGEQRLVAYVVTAMEPGPAASELRSFLWEKLPGPMIPTVFVRLAALPLTPNGKVDRGALPVPDQARPELDETSVAPRTPLESRIAEIWQNVLEVDRVGVYDNFFDLGGSSLLSLQVVARVEKAIGLRVNPRHMISQTLGQFAAMCEERLDREPEAPTSLTQRLGHALKRLVSHVTEDRQ